MRGYPRQWNPNQSLCVSSLICIASLRSASQHKVGVWRLWSRKAMCIDTNLSDHLEVRSFLLTNWMKLHVDQFVSVAKELVNYERRRTTSNLNFSAFLPYHIHHPIGSIWANVVVSDFASYLLKVGPWRLINATHCVQSKADSSLIYIFPSDFMKPSFTSLSWRWRHSPKSFYIPFGIGSIGCHMK